MSVLRGQNIHLSAHLCILLCMYTVLTQLLKKIMDLHKSNIIPMGKILAEIPYYNLKDFGY